MKAETKQAILSRLKEKYNGEVPFDIGWLSEGTLLGHLVESTKEVLEEEQHPPMTADHREWLISCRAAAQKIVDQFDMILANGYPEKKDK